MARSFVHKKKINGSICTSQELDITMSVLDLFTDLLLQGHTKDARTRGCQDQAYLDSTLTRLGLDLDPALLVDNCGTQDEQDSKWKGSQVNVTEATKWCFSEHSGSTRRDVRYVAGLNADAI